MVKKEFICESCGRTFRNAAGLAGHTQFSSCGDGTGKMNQGDSAPTTADGLKDVIGTIKEKTSLNKAKLNLAASQELLNENKEKPKDNDFWGSYKEELQIMLMEERIKDLRESRNRKHDSNDGEILKLVMSQNQNNQNLLMQMYKSNFDFQLKMLESDRNLSPDKIINVINGYKDLINSLGLEKDKRDSLAMQLMEGLASFLNRMGIAEEIGTGIKQKMHELGERPLFPQPQQIEQPQEEFLMGQRVSDNATKSATMQVLNTQPVQTDGNGVVDDFGIIWSEDKSHATTPDGKYFNVEKFDETNLEKFQKKYMTTPTTNILANEIVEETIAKDEDVDLFAGGEVLLK
jgi:hypothetical protein